MKRLTTFVVAVALLLGRPSLAQPAAGSLSPSLDPEQTARAYMAAFFQGDLRTAANLTHPDTLREIRQAFLTALDQATASGRGKEFLASAGIAEDPTKLRSVSPDDLYVILVESNHRMAGAAYEANKRAMVVVIGSERDGEDSARVRVSVTTPARDGGFTQAGVVQLQKYRGTWKVTASTP